MVRIRSGISFDNLEKKPEHSAKPQRSQGELISMERFFLAFLACLASLRENAVFTEFVGNNELPVFFHLKDAPYGL